eukprot:scaffold115873_cov26-Tisochrysis_lutea.AAC.1
MKMMIRVAGNNNSATSDASTPTGRCSEYELETATSNKQSALVSRWEQPRARTSWEQKLFHNQQLIAHLIANCNCSRSIARNYATSS